LADRDRDGSAEKFAAVLSDKDAVAYHGPAAFGLALARWSLLHTPGAEVYEPLGRAANSGHAVYAPAARYLLALWHTGRGSRAKAQQLWQEIAAAGGHAYAPVAHYALGCGHTRDEVEGIEGDDDAAAAAMRLAWSSGDAEYGPKALAWLCAHAVRTGRPERVERLVSSFLCLPFPRLVFEGPAFEAQKIANWRHVLLNRSEPAAAFQIAETLARADYVREGGLLAMIDQDLDDKDETSLPEEIEAPWFATHLDAAGPHDLYVLAAQLFTTVDSMYIQAAIPCLEGDNGPNGALRAIIGQVDQHPWGADLHANARIQLIKAIDGPDDLIPEGWPHREASST
jgi:hypothetical protein